MSHVRSWDTKTPVGESKKQFEDLIRRYGATGFTVSEDYAARTVLIGFSVQVSGGETADVRLPVSYRSVKAKLFKVREFKIRADNKGEEWADAQAARVAWRHLLLWAEGALAAVDAGLYSLQEAFFAHTMIPTPNGGYLPAIDAVNAVKLIAARAAE